jgi:arsenate reductase
MKTRAATVALGALAQEMRLTIFRLLVQAGPQGLSPGSISRTLGTPAPTLSFHLQQLRTAGLVSRRRDGRSLIYSAEFGAMRALIGYLTENCCGGDAAACGFGAAATAAGEGACDMTVMIYHNPACGTSRNVLGLIRNSGEEPEVIEYLRTPPDRATLTALIARMGIAPRDLLRRKDTPYDALGLGDPDLADDALIDAMLAHPILINRPIVVTALGARLCRPSETVLDILPSPQRGAFAKEDGAPVVGDDGRLVRG